MSMRRICEEVQLDRYPEQTNAIGSVELTIGDLHGNALKLMYFLVRHEIVILSIDDYASFVQIYNLPTDLLNHTKLDEFDAILARLRVANCNVHLRFLGDEVADQGSNDYFTLKILEKLHQQHIRFEILFSEQGSRFIQTYEKHKCFYDPKLDSRQVWSMYKLHELVQRGLVSRDRIEDIVENVYKPALKAISYNICPEGISIFSYAPIELNVVRLLAEQLNMSYKDGSPQLLAQTIEGINQAFGLLVRYDALHHLYRTRPIRCSMSDEPALNAIEMISKNHYEEDIIHINRHNEYFVNYVYGHVEEEYTHSSYLSLCTNLGASIWQRGSVKPESNLRGQYQVLISDIKPVIDLTDAEERLHTEGEHRGTEQAVGNRPLASALSLFAGGARGHSAQIQEKAVTLRADLAT